MATSASLSTYMSMCITKNRILRRAKCKKLHSKNLADASPFCRRLLEASEVDDLCETKKWLRHPNSLICVHSSCWSENGENQMFSQNKVRYEAILGAIVSC